MNTYLILAKTDNELTVVDHFNNKDEAIIYLEEYKINYNSNDLMIAYYPYITTTIKIN